MPVTSGERHWAREAKRAKTGRDPQTTVPHTSARCELDTRADTICAGCNFRLLSTTGQLCDVSAFHSDFESIKDVPIATVATAFQAESGTIYILIVNEALFFGVSMGHSLINPNQIRHHGIVVCDNPFDSIARLGIDHVDAFIPFTTSGAAVFFDTFVPSDEELAKCKRIELTSGSEWNPKTVMMNSNRPYGDNANERIVQSVVRENIKRREVPVEYESDLVLGSISGSFVANDMYERLVSTVKVSQRVKQRPQKVPPHKKRPVIRKMVANTRHSVITPEHVAKIMHMGLDKAKNLLKVTTQKGVRTAVHPIHRRYRTDHIDLNRDRLRGKWYVDWMPAKRKSITQATGAWIYTNGFFSEVYPSESKKSTNASQSLNDFCQDVGIPEHIKSDRAPELCGRTSAFLSLAKRKHIECTYAEPEQSKQMWQINIEIRELKKRYHSKMTEKKVPKRLWDYGFKHAAKMMQFVPRQSLGNRTPIEAVTGKTPDISEYLDFDFYDLVWYFPGVHPSISEENRALGRWLGVSHRIGSDMCYWIMPVSGNPIAETTVQHVTRDDILDADISAQITEFNQNLTKRLDDTNFILMPGNQNFEVDDEYDDFAAPDDDPAYGDNTPTEAQYGSMATEFTNVLPDEDEIKEAEVYDKYIGVRIVLDEDTNDGGNLATVKRRVTDMHGRPSGTAHNNPMLDSREYEIELEDGTVDRIFANKIAQNLYSQVDDEGREILAFQEIIGHRANKAAMTKENGFIEHANGHRKPKKTTHGWEIEVEFRDSTTTWMSLRDVKEANPIELAEYAVGNNIDDEPAFAWWVPYTLKKRERMISKVKTKYWRTTHKYGVRLPKNAAEALEIDKETGTDYWEKAMNKEMKKAKVSYEEVEGCTPEEVRSGQVPELNGYTEITCHLIFDVKMDFTRKARFVANGSMTDTPVSLCYSSVVSRDSVRLAFLVAALNDLDIFACDIGNAYLNAPCKEKIWFVAKIECGREACGKVMRLCRALYGLKSSGASWRQMFKNYIESKLGFTPSTADGDMYYRKNKMPSGAEYYELLLVYVDDVLAVSHDPGAIMKMIGMRFEIKNDEWGPPKRYLGADVELFQLPNGRFAWSLGSYSYVVAAVQTVRDLLAEDGRDLKTGKRPHKGPLPSGYKPELDVTDECDAEYHSRFQQLIGILRWAVELGRIDIEIEVALMSQYQASSRYGHLEALYLIFHFLWKNPKKRLVMDPLEPGVDEDSFQSCANWKEFYGNVTEEDPPRMPEPLGCPVSMTAFVDADHASNVVSRRSHTGYFLFIMNALMCSFSKKQNTVESSTYGSELVALRIVRDRIVAMRIKCKSIGVPLMGPANVYCDNQGVVMNTSIPGSTLSKKHNSINYHIIRETAAAGIMRVGKEDTNTNLADALTKLQPYSKKQALIGNILWDY